MAGFALGWRRSLATDNTAGADKKFISNYARVVGWLGLTLALWPVTLSLIPQPSTWDVMTVKKIAFILMLGLGAVLLAGIIWSAIESKRAVISQKQDSKYLRALSSMILEAAFENEMAGRPWVFPGVSQLEEAATDDAIRTWIAAKRGNLFTPLKGQGFDAALGYSTDLLLELRRPGGKTLGVTVTGSMKIMD